MNWNRHRPNKPMAPFRVVTRGSLQHVVEKQLGRWNWEPVAWTTSRKLAEQVYTRRMMDYVEEAFR